MANTALLYLRIMRITFDTLSSPYEAIKSRYSENKTLTLKGINVSSLEKIRPYRPQKACLAVLEHLSFFVVVDIVALAFQTLGGIARLSHKINQVLRRLQSLPLSSGDQKCPKGSLFLPLYSNKWSKKKRKSSFTIHSDYAAIRNPRLTFERFGNFFAEEL